MASHAAQVRSAAGNHSRTVLSYVHRHRLQGDDSDNQARLQLQLDSSGTVHKHTVACIPGHALAHTAARAGHRIPAVRACTEYIRHLCSEPGISSLGRDMAHRIHSPAAAGTVHHRIRLHGGRPPGRHCHRWPAHFGHLHAGLESPDYILCRQRRYRRPPHRLRHIALAVAGDSLPGSPCMVVPDT